VRHSKIARSMTEMGQSPRVNRVPLTSTLALETDTLRFLLFDQLVRRDLYGLRDREP
jgi:hypothetical protein